MPGIGEWHIVSLLSEEFLKRLNWIYVFGNSGNEVLLFTNDDQVYVLGANTNCCLGMSKSSQVGLEPKLLEKLVEKSKHPEQYMLHVKCTCICFILT